MGTPGGAMTAQRLLVERQDRAAVPMLMGLLHDKTNPLARLHALWTLVALNGVDSAVVNDVIADPHPALREHALRVASAIEPQCARTMDFDGPSGQLWPRIPRSAFVCKRRWHWAIAVAMSRPRSMPWARSRRATRMIPGCGWRS